MLRLGIIDTHSSKNVTNRTYRDIISALGTCASGGKGYIDTSLNPLSKGECCLINVVFAHCCSLCPILD